MRNLFLIVAIVLVFFIVRLLLRRAGSAGKRRVEGPRQMVRCDHCGLHVPDDEAVRSQDGHVFCSEEHRLSGPKK